MADTNYLTLDGLKHYNEKVVALINAGGEGSVVTIKEDTTQTTYAKVYEFYQGDNTDPANKIGVVNVPKDLVVESGSVVVVTASEAGTPGFPAKEGTYIKLVIANSTADPIWVDVASLVDNYTAAPGATEVQVAIDGTTRVISASLTADVKAQLGRADSSVQAVKASDASTGTDGTITVTTYDASTKTNKDAEVAVKGLGNGAFTNFTAITDAEIDALFTP